MIVIGLTTNVATDAELKALTGMVDQDFVYHTGNNKPYQFRNNRKEGDFQADDLSGWWLEDHIPCLDLLEYKHYRIDEINFKTTELIDGGYITCQEAIKLPALEERLQRLKNSLWKRLLILYFLTIRECSNRKIFILCYIKSYYATNYRYSKGFSCRDS